MPRLRATTSSPAKLLSLAAEFSAQTRERPRALDFGSNGVNGEFKPVVVKVEDLKSGIAIEETASFAATDNAGVGLPKFYELRQDYFYDSLEYGFSPCRFPAASLSGRNLCQIQPAQLRFIPMRQDPSCRRAGNPGADQRMCPLSGQTTAAHCPSESPLVLSSHAFPGRCFLPKLRFHRRIHAAVLR